TATPIPRSPFMPAAAWPGTAQRYSYLPFFKNTTVIVAVCPCFRVTVDLPVHEFLAVVDTGTEQTLKLWKASPRSVTLKITVPPGRFENFESLNASSEGFPAVTVTVVTAGALCVVTRPNAGPAAASKSHAATPRTETPKTALIERFRCIDRDNSFPSDAPWRPPRTTRRSTPEVGQYSHLLAPPWSAARARLKRPALSRSSGDLDVARRCRLGARACAARLRVTAVG